MNLEGNRNLALGIIICILVGTVIYWGIGGDNKNNQIFLGEPCDVSDLESYNGGGEMKNTKGLQCYVYDDLSIYPIHNGVWIYPSGIEMEKKGVWIYPNGINEPLFASENFFFDNVISLTDMTKNWVSYHNTIGNYSFKIPQQWKVRMEDPSDSNQILVESGPLPGEALIPLVRIKYYPNSVFYETEDYKIIEEAPHNWLVADTSTDTFLYKKEFDLNGNSALLVSRTLNFDLGDNPAEVKIYLTKEDSYYEISYRENLDSLNIPLEILIKTFTLD